MTRLRIAALFLVAWLIVAVMFRAKGDTDIVMTASDPAS
jgi:hypothetical protein